MIRVWIDPLAGIEVKFKRGDHHLERLQLEVAAFLHSKPWHVDFTRLPGRGYGWYLATFRVDRLQTIEVLALLAVAATLRAAASPRTPDRAGCCEVPHT